MASDEMVFVFAYDVSDDRIRNRVADILEQRAVRVQKSVFEVRLSQRAANLLFRRITQLLDDGDSLRMYALSKTSMNHSEVHGGAPLPEEEPFWLL